LSFGEDIKNQRFQFKAKVRFGAEADCAILGLINCPVSKKYFRSACGAYWGVWRYLMLADVHKNKERFQ